MTYNLPVAVNLPKGMPNYEKLNKAKNIYSRMAIVFDYEFYEDGRDDTKLYQYLYFIFYMLACKKSYFPYRFDDYDGYAIYASREIYMRAIRFQKKGVRIKSILNYAKAVAYSMKVLYQNETFHRIINPEVIPFDSNSYEDNMKASIQADYNIGKNDAISDILGSMPRIIKSILDKTPYKSNKIIYGRLYKSCLLSFINSITLQSKSANCMKSMKDSALIKSLQKEKERPVVLFGLDESMANYVMVLLREAKSVIADQVTETSNSFNLSDTNLNDIIQDLYSTGNTEPHANATNDF